MKPGETVEAVILGVNARRAPHLSGPEAGLGDPWAGAAEKFAPGTVIEGPVTNITKFGAFVQLTEGVEGMIHVSEISAEKRINHPQEVLRVGQIVKAQVLALDTEKRNIRLSMKQLVPTGLDEYLAEHKEGDVVTGRITEVSGASARVELGEGVVATCRIACGACGERRQARGSRAFICPSPICLRWDRCCRHAGKAALPPPRRSRKVCARGRFASFAS